MLPINELCSQCRIKGREKKNIVYVAYILKQTPLNEKATSECNPEKAVGSYDSIDEKQLWSNPII